MLSVVISGFPEREKYFRFWEGLQVMKTDCGHCYIYAKKSPSWAERHRYYGQGGICINVLPAGNQIFYILPNFRFFPVLQ
jgi:hypothetical protein